MRTRYGPGASIPTDDGAEIEALAGSNPSFAAWEQDELYTIALLIKGRSGGASTKHLYRSGSSSTGDHILFLTSGTTPNLRHQSSGGGTVIITSSVAIVNDTTWSTLVGTWQPGRLELYVDGWSRASSTAAATSTSALFGIYRWGWGFSTSQDFNGDIALIACFASSWTPAMVRRWHADPLGFLRPWNELPALATRHAPLDRYGRGRLPDGVMSNRCSTRPAGAPIRSTQATQVIPSATTNAAIGNWNQTTDRNWHAYIDFIYLWNRVLDLGARRALQNNPWQFVKPRLSGRTYMAYGITASTPPRGDSGKGSIVIAITS